mgnify:CR=1 FL=1
MSDFLEAVGYGVLNDVLGLFRSDDGYAHPNRYEVMINPPIGEQSSNFFAKGMGDTRVLKKLSLHCESVSFPGQNISTTDDTNVYGPVRQVAESVNYAENVSLTFQTSSDLEERDFFEDWHRRIYNEGNWNMQYYNTYVGSLEIYLLDKESKRRYGIKCWEAYPKTISPVSLNYGTRDEIVKIDVDFIFRYWTTLKISRQGTNLFGNIAETIVDTAERRLSANVPKVISKLL